MKLKTKSKEQGVALLISLGMLSLLLVIVVSFIFTARIDLMVSSFHVDDTASKRFAASSNILVFSPLQADGAKMPKIQQLRQAEKNTTDWPLAYDYSSDREAYTSNNWSKGAISKFEDRKDGHAISYNLGFMATPQVEEIYSSSLNSSRNNLAWWHDFSRSEETDMDGSTIEWSDDITGNANNVDGNIMSQNTYIAGRYMYLMTDESIKFDLNGILYNQKHKLLHANFFEIDEMFDELGLDGKALTKGLDQLPNLNGKDRFWESWRHIWNEGFFAKDYKFPTLSEEKSARDVYNLFTPYSFPTGEFMYYIPKNLKNDWTQRRFVHRFFVGNLVNNKNVESLIDAPETYQQEYDFFDTTNFPDGEGRQVAAVLEQKVARERNSTSQDIYTNTTVKFIPWLSHIASSLDNKEGQYSREIQKQVAANLIDYSDSDSEATTDYKSFDANDKIEYCGLEKAPYVAGINISVTFTANVDSQGKVIPGEFKIRQVGAFIQASNIYDEALTADISFEAQVEGVQQTISGSGEQVECAARSLNTAVATSNELIDQIYQKGDNLKFEKFVVKLTSKGQVADISMLTDITGGKLDKLGHGRSYNLLVEFRDPRCNNYLSFASDKANHRTLYSSTTDIKWDEGKTGSFRTEINIDNSFYPGSENLIDKETDYNSLSTAHIRNKQITTLWELGCIHRGEPWRTINLKSSCKTNAQNKIDCQHGWIRSRNQAHFNNMAWEYNGGVSSVPPFYYSGKYALGDAALLNQLKLTKQIETYPCINIFNPNEKYWHFIFDKVFKNDQVKMNGQFTGTTDVVYPLKGKLDSSDESALLKVIKRSAEQGIGAGPGYNSYHLSSQIGDKEGLWCIMYDKPGLNSVKMKREFGTVAKDDFYAEELIGKLADQVKINFNLYRFVSTYQKLAYMSAIQSQILDDIAQGDEDDPRLNGYVKLELLGDSDVRDDSWFKIMGEQKMMTIMKRPKDTGRFEILENTVLDSF